MSEASDLTIAQAQSPGRQSRELAGDSITDLTSRANNNRGSPVPAPGTPAARLRQLRLERGYRTFHAVAHAMGISQGDYYRHETGQRVMSAKAAERYGLHFGVPASYLLYGGASLSVPVIGLVETGGRVVRFGQNSAPHTVPSPSKDAMDRWVALVVTGSSLRPMLNDQDVVFFNPDVYAAPVDRKLVNKRLCIVHTASDGHGEVLRYIASMRNSAIATLQDHALTEERSISLRAAAPIMHIALAVSLNGG